MARGPGILLAIRSLAVRLLTVRPLAIRPLAFQALAMVALGTGCGKPSQTAEEIFAKAQATFDDEQYAQALALIPGDAVLRELKADRGLRDRFQLLQAETLAAGPDLVRGMALLATPLPEGASPVLERQRRRTLGFGRCRTARAAGERQAGLAILDTVLAETEAGSSEAGNVELRRGACLRAMGQFERAEAAARSALAAARAAKDGLLEAKSLSSLGSICAIQERFSEAATHMREALRVAERSGPAARHVKRRGIDNLGWYQFELGDYDQALETLGKLQPMNERERIVNENNQARTLLAMENLAGAQSHYEKALAAARAPGGVEASDEAAVMLGLALLSYRQGKWFEAARWNREARALNRKLGRADLERTGALTEARILLAQGDPGGTEPLLRGLLADGETSRQIRWTAHMELGQLLARQGRAAQAEAEFQKAMRLVEEARSGLTAAEDRISFISGRMEVYGAMLRFLLQQNRPDEALRVAERSRARALGGRTAQRRRTTVLFYWLDEPASHLWVVDPVKAPVYLRLPGAREIQDLVERHNQFLLRARNPLTDGGREARQLFEMLVKPALAHLGGRRVLLSPDGGLHALNFETLIAPGPDHYWLEDVEISVVPGMTGGVDGTRPRSGPVLLAGDALDAEAGFARLRHAGEELDRIGAQFGTAPLKRAEATPGAVRARLAKNPAYVHFAAHAQANRLRPLESAILLSPDAEGYKLYARDVAGKPLRAQLVTLSACTAAGAKAFKGEGLVGFAWAFLGAGAENVVASLWEVDDASTPQLMDQMYRQLRLGRTPGEALREAKLALLRSGTALQKPYFWGAFLHFQP